MPSPTNKIDNFKSVGDTEATFISTDKTKTNSVEHYFNEEFVDKVRQQFLKKHGNISDKNSDREISENNSLYEMEDIELIKRDNWFIRRFLAWRPTTVDEAVKAIHEALIWRKNIQILSWKDSNFPSEFYQLAACFRYMPDRENHNVLILRLRFNKKDPTGLSCMDQLAKNYFIYVVEKIVSQNPNQGFGIIFDCHKASLSNVDLDMARFIINTLSGYYSGAIAYVCIYELPWVFNQIWRIIRSWLDEDARKIIKFATLATISEIIDPENLPDYMGGSATLDYRFVPKGVVSIEEMAQNIGITNRKDIAKLNEHFQKLIRMS